METMLIGNWILLVCYLLLCHKRRRLRERRGKDVDAGTTPQTDGYRGYNKLKELLTGHQVIIEPDKRKVAKLFPWANRTINNAKKVLLGSIIIVSMTAL